MKPDKDGWIDRNDALPGVGVKRYQVRFGDWLGCIQDYDEGSIEGWTHWRPAPDQAQERDREPWELYIGNVHEIRPEEENLFKSGFVCGRDYESKQATKNSLKIKLGSVVRLRNGMIVKIVDIEEGNPFPAACVWELSFGPDGSYQVEYDELCKCKVLWEDNKS